MIVIKIKTWKDYKQDFLKWVQAPRRSTCKDQIQDITEAGEKCVAESAEETRKLIDDCQPAKLL